MRKASLFVALIVIIFALFVFLLKDQFSYTSITDSADIKSPLAQGNAVTSANPAQSVSPLQLAQQSVAGALKSIALQPLSISPPTPKQDSAVVYGKLVLDPNSAALEMFLHGQIFLAPYVYAEDGVTPLISLDIGTDQLADQQTDSSEFLFRTAKPGKYGVVIYTPFNSYLLPDPSGKGGMVIEILAGQSYDLGAVVIK